MAIPKFITGEQAGQLIKDGDTICTCGFIGMGCADEIFYNIEKRYLETGAPKDLILTWGASVSDSATYIGCNRFAHDGMVKRIIVGHIGLTVDLVKMAVANKFEAFNFPQGVLLHLYRAKGGKKPCIVTPVGLGTYVDPREEGGRLNEKARQSDFDIVSVVEIDGEEYLMYKTFPIDVAIIRGTTADEKGNITLEREACILEDYSIALAAKASGGIVIAQVERQAYAGTLNPKDVRVPGTVVDYIVVASDPKFHEQSFYAPYDGSLCGEFRVPLDAVEPMPLTERKILARRGAMELVPQAIVNLGIGVPSDIGSIAAEEGLAAELTMSVESGPVGGAPCSGLKFGCAINADAIIESNEQFDFYDCGGLDLTVLGMAELDEGGNVNVSKFGPKIAGCGGFINITQNTNVVVFTGTFTAGGLKVKTGDGKLEIVQEGKVKKLIKAVEQKTFSGATAVKNGQKILYVTERAVFEMRPEGLTLVEIAPGIDLQTQVLDLMEFKPVVAPDLKLMDERIFKDEPMGIYDEIMAKAK